MIETLTIGVLARAARSGDLGDAIQPSPERRALTTEDLPVEELRVTNDV